MNTEDKNLLTKFVMTYPDKRWDSLIMIVILNGIENLKEDDIIPPSMLKTLKIAKERQLTDPILQHAEFGYKD